MRQVKIGVGIVSSGLVMHDWVLCLLGMLKEMPYDYQIFEHKSCLVPKNRRIIAEEFCQSDCTHLLFIDTDMLFPNQAVQALVEADKEVVAVNCTNRKSPVRFTAQRAGVMVPTKKDSVGLEEVDRVGTGVILIERQVFNFIQKPWFGLGWNPKSGQELGEDYMFCQQCNKASIPIYIDHDLSRAVFHMGIYPYGARDYIDE